MNKTMNTVMKTIWMMLFMSGLASCGFLWDHEICYYAETNGSVQASITFTDTFGIEQTVQTYLDHDHVWIMRVQPTTGRRCVCRVTVVSGTGGISPRIYFDGSLKSTVGHATSTEISFIP